MDKRIKARPKFAPPFNSTIVESGPRTLVFMLVCIPWRLGKDPMFVAETRQITDNSRGNELLNGNLPHKDKK